MTIFSVNTPNLASNEDSLLSGAALTPPAEGTPEGSFAAVLGASSPAATPAVPAAVGKKRESKGAPFAAGPANGNLNSAQFQRSATTASQADQPVQSENAALPVLTDNIAVETGEASASESENHSIDVSQGITGQVIFPSVPINPLLQQMIGEVPSMAIQSTATASLAASIEGVAALESSPSNLPEGINAGARINRSYSPGTAQNRSTEFGAVTKLESGNAGLIKKTLSSGGAAPLMPGSSPGQGSKNASLPESGNVETRNNFNGPPSETVGTVAVGTSGSSNNLNAAANQPPNGPTMEQPKDLVESQVPPGQTAGTDSSIEVPPSPELLKHEALRVKGNFEIRTPTSRVSESAAEVEQPEMSRPIAANGKPDLRPGLKGMAEVPGEFQQPQLTQEVEAAIEVSAARSESSEITTRPNRNFASPPPQSIPRNLTRAPAIKSANQLGIAARQTAGSVGSNVALEARIGQLSVPPATVPQSTAIVRKSGLLENLSAASKTENNVVLEQTRTQQSSQRISSTGANLAAQEVSALGLKAEAKGTASVTSSQTSMAAKESVAISSRTSKGQPGAIPAGPNGQPIRAIEAPPKSVQEMEMLGSHQTPRESSYPKVESGSALPARSDAPSLRLPNSEKPLNLSTTVPKPQVTLEGRLQEQSDQSFVEAKTDARTEAKTQPAAQASVIFDTATERGIAKPLDFAPATPLKSSDQLNRDLLRVSEKEVPATLQAASSETGEFDSLGQDKEESSGNFSGESTFSQSESQEVSPEFRRGFEPSETSSVFARSRSRDLNVADLPDRSPTVGGTLDAQHGSAMALRANHETGHTTFGKNIPSVGKNDSLLGPNEQIVSGPELRSAGPEVFSQRVLDASLMVNFSSTDAGKVSERGISDFGEVGRVGQSRLAGEVWSAVEKFRATSDQDWVVSIRPDQDTHLNLKMKLEDNQLLIQATLESGDWDAVAPHWPELQAAFADRGVQLKALEAGTGQNFLPSQFNQAGSHGQEHRQAAADLAYAREFFEMNHGFTRGRAETKKPAVSETPSRPNRVLETWA